MVERLNDTYESAQRSARLAHQAGVQVAMGSNAGTPLNRHGENGLGVLSDEPRSYASVWLIGVVFLVVVGLYFFGGVVLRDFALAMILGVLVGTYSSVFVASPIVFAWRKEAKRVTVKREKVAEMAAQKQKAEDKKTAPKPKPKRI